ncbi:DUF3152 domain-containing protein [Thermomonospora sp. CIF 1]|mgnify:CR=1 FL=1|uniref:DUF3152 domain-containing protein n=1 Tax=Thermomonospora sp. CIF 1 TaxID=1916083 RepID=UPI000A8BF73C|nr:DUF3152 domain-containing protein [Thermomonospora sp. CIF 1]PKK12858.1 MAG: hypothetical protein BUE48_021260 [Thermomonospora sp. CIF 1]
MYEPHSGGGSPFGEDWPQALHGAYRRRRGGGFLMGLLLACLSTAAVTAFTWVYPSGESTGPAAGTVRQSALPAALSAPAAAPVTVPRRGTGRFVRAPGSTPKVGRGRLLRYAVEVEDGIGQQAAEFARIVDGVLAHRRGWTAGGEWAFKRVSSSRYDFVVRLASPDTVDEICARYGLDTEGEVNCAGGRDVVINLRRWLLLTPYYKDRPALYRALAINHEVGHRLGHGHVTCPRKGRPAPVMQQQIFGLKGCVINAWPYDARGRFITGPSVS